MSFERGTEQEAVYCQLVNQMGGWQSEHIRHSPLNPKDKKAISEAKEVKRIVEKRIVAVRPDCNVNIRSDGYVYCCCASPDRILIRTLYFIAAPGTIDEFTCKTCGQKSHCVRQ
jgi:hypothetical protein